MLLRLVTLPGCDCETGRRRVWWTQGVLRRRSTSAYLQHSWEPSQARPGHACQYDSPTLPSIMCLRVYVQMAAIHSQVCALSLVVMRLLMTRKSRGLQIVLCVIRVQARIDAACNTVSVAAASNDVAAPRGAGAAASGSGCALVMSPHPVGLPFFLSLLAEPFQLLVSQGK